jgi:hypothetical protein
VSALQRYRDWRLERRIKALSAECLALYSAGRKASARDADNRRMQLIRSRSPGQVRRMESRMDFNVRRTIKRRVMDAFLRGRIPSSIVTAVFRLLRLRSL